MYIPPPRSFADLRRERPMDCQWYIYIYIYIYRERERERDTYIIIIIIIIIIITSPNCIIMYLGFSNGNSLFSGAGSNAPVTQARMLIDRPEMNRLPESIAAVVSKPFCGYAYN